MSGARPPSGADAAIGALGAISEILTWVGLGAGLLFGALAVLSKLADGTWLPAKAVIIDDVAPGGSPHDVVRWFGDRDGVHEAPLTPELRAAAVGDEVSLYYRLGTPDRVRLEPRSPWPRLLGGVASACGGVGILAVIAQIVTMVARG